MGRLLRDGDLVYVLPFHHGDQSTLSEGELILFLRDNTPIVHRLLRVEGDHLIEKGDHAAESGMVDRKDVIGRVVRRKRDGVEQALSMPLKWMLRRWWHRMWGKG